MEECLSIWDFDKEFTEENITETKPKNGYYYLVAECAETREGFNAYYESLDEASKVFDSLSNHMEKTLGLSYFDKNGDEKIEAYLVVGNECNYLTLDWVNKEYSYLPKTKFEEFYKLLATIAYKYKHLPSVGTMQNKIEYYYRHLEVKERQDKWRKLTETYRKNSTLSSIFSIPSSDCNFLGALKGASDKELLTAFQVYLSFPQRGKSSFAKIKAELKKRHIEMKYYETDFVEDKKKKFSELEAKGLYVYSMISTEGTSYNICSKNRFCNRFGFIVTSIPLLLNEDDVITCEEFETLGFKYDATI